jgi:long-subunit fatty acid transport protein
MVKASAAASYDVHDMVSIGVGMHLLTGVFESLLVASACDGDICTVPENYDYDTPIQIKSGTILKPGAQVGLIVRPATWLRFGASWETGYNIDQSATLRVRLPTASAYDDAYVTPEEPRGRIKFKLPQKLRFGVEGNYEDLFNIEASVVWENWSAHKDIRIEVNEGTIHEALQIDPFRLGDVTTPRQFRDVVSYRLGGEFRPHWLSDRNLTLRGGLMYEPSAVPSETLTAMSVDLNKIMVALGAAYQLGRHFLLEASYAHIFMQSRDVQTSTVRQVNPTRPAWNGTTTVGEGRYSGSAHLFGLGLKAML